MQRESRTSTSSQGPLRRRWLAITTLVLAGAFASACNESLVAPVVGSIQGTVTVDGTGLDGVTISLGSGATVTTSGGGSYAFNSVMAGTHTVTISGFPPEADFPQATGTATISTSGQTVVVDFSGAYIRNATIVGAVTIAHRRFGGTYEHIGLKDVTVSASGVESKTATTDADGNFVLSGLRGGSYTVMISGYDDAMYVFDNTSESVSIGGSESKEVSFGGMTAPLPGQAEFMVRIENVSKHYQFSSSGHFAVPVGAEGPGPLLPDHTYSFTFHSGPGLKLSFATMFVQSNDLFYAPNGDGIEIWADDGPITGDITDQIMLWDSGTEVNQEPGTGADQPLQGGDTSGDVDPDATVRLATDDFGNLPEVSDVIRVTLHHDGPSETLMRLTIENVGTATTLMTADGMSHPTPLAPGAFVVHSAPNPLFTEGEADRGEGLEGLAESGAIGDLAGSLDERSGLTSLIAPGVYTSDPTGSLVFMADVTASPGLESMAEDGMPGTLAAEVEAAGGFLDGGVFAVPVGADGPAPVGPGGAYEFNVIATPGDVLSFVTMFVQSNDLFYAPSAEGVDLFPDGVALEGDITDMILLWDGGTEVNARPGFGSYQAPRQPGANMGPDEGGLVNILEPCFPYPELGDVLRVTVTKVAG